MAGEPGLLPAWLYERFRPTEIYSPDRAAIARGRDRAVRQTLDAQATTTVTLTRSHCEVADQWSYPELMELLTTAREHFFLDDSIPAHIGRLAVATPIQSMAAVFQRHVCIRFMPHHYAGLRPTGAAGCRDCSDLRSTIRSIRDSVLPPGRSSSPFEPVIVAYFYDGESGRSRSKSKCAPIAGISALHGPG